MVHIGDRLSGDGPTITRQLLPLLEPGDIITQVQQTLQPDQNRADGEQARATQPARDPETA